MEGFFSRYSSQPVSQGVTLLFFFTEKKKRSKKRKELAYPCTVRQCFTRRLHKKLFSSQILTNKNPPAGRTGDPPHAVTLPFSQLKLGRKVSGDSPHAVTLPFLQLKLGRKISGDPPRKEKKKQKKKRVRLPLYCTAMLHTKITQETVTIDSHQQISPGGANRRLLPP